MQSSSSLEKIFKCGQLITTNFEGDYRLTYCRVPLEKTIPNNTRFCCGDIGLIVETIDVPDLFYTSGFAMILVPQGRGWVPFEWLKSLS
ncbi:MAG: hypothetical protein EBU90_23530 [Proteobacteria bacterium]|jgi:hypothetical protein|nr:hypothetical protein [Pseudomonadota bacterium]